MHWSSLVPGLVDIIEGVCVWTGQVGKFSLYLLVPAGLTFAVVGSPDTLERIIQSVSTSPDGAAESQAIKAINTLMLYFGTPGIWIAWWA